MLCQKTHTIWQNRPSEALLFSVRQSWIKVDVMSEWKKKEKLSKLNTNITSFIILLSHNWWSSVRIHGDHEWTASVKSRLRSGLWLRDIDVMLCSVAPFFFPSGSLSQVSCRLHQVSPPALCLCFSAVILPSTLTGACSREASPWHCLHNASPRGCGDVSVHRSLFQLTSSSFIFEVLRVAFSLSHCNKTATGEAPGTTDRLPL